MSNTDDIPTSFGIGAPRALRLRAGGKTARGKRLSFYCLAARAVAEENYRNYYDTYMAHDAVIVIGNESTGISEELMDISDEKIRIPMSGDVDSINAAIAAGILMYTSVAQQRRM